MRGGVSQQLLFGDCHSHLLVFVSQQLLQGQRDESVRVDLSDRPRQHFLLLCQLHHLAVPIGLSGSPSGRPDHHELHFDSVSFPACSFRLQQHLHQSVSVWSVRSSHSSFMLDHLHWFIPEGRLYLALRAEVSH